MNKPYMSHIMLLEEEPYNTLTLTSSTLKMFNNTRPLLVNVSASSDDGKPAVEFTGFLYSESADVVVTTGHVVGSGSPTAERRFRALYDGGFEEDLVLLKHASSNVPDIAIFRGSRRAHRSLQGTGFATGDAVYAFGFSPSFNDPGFKKGTVSSNTVGSEAIITALSDSGYIGGPVMNGRGQLVGIIKGATTTTMQEVGITPAADLYTFLLQSGQPGLLV
jgi:hypothetical protein